MVFWCFLAISMVEVKFCKSSILDDSGSACARCSLPFSWKENLRDLSLAFLWNRILEESVSVLSVVCDSGRESGVPDHCPWFLLSRIAGELLWPWDRVWLPTSSF